jgi:hypothetical protein
MLHLSPQHLIYGFTVRALPCVFDAQQDRSGAALAGTVRGISQSVISKQLPSNMVGNSFETTFSPGGGGV